MKVTKIFGTKTADTLYPYQYRVELPTSFDLHDKEKIIDWIRDINLQCCYTPNAVYVRDEKDASMFLMRWA